MRGLGFLHLRDTLQEQQHAKWTNLLSEEIWKAEKLMDRENLTQNKRDDRRNIVRKNEIFKNGIKGIEKITGKYNTSKPLTEVKISCPCGMARRRVLPGSTNSAGEEDKSLDKRMHSQASILPGSTNSTGEEDKSLDKRMHSQASNLTYKGDEIRLESLAEMTLLIQATQPHLQDLNTRSLIYDTGPWKDDNLLVGIETFFQRNAYHLYATCGNTECGKTGPISMSQSPRAPHQDNLPRSEA